MRMKNKAVKTPFVFFVILITLISLVSFPVQGGVAYSDAQEIINGIAYYKSGTGNIQYWIDNQLTANAGSSEWYVIALGQYGNYDFSFYKKALVKYLSENEIGSASSRQKYALTLIACGISDSYITETLNNSIGRQGIMSWVFGLHLLNNGYKSSEYSVSSVKSQLLSLQLADGGWTVMGGNSDVDVTAMVIQALAPYYSSDSSVKKAIDKGLAFLSGKQNDTGDFASYGVNNPESTAQVLVALSALGIDCEKDERFIKNGNTLFDGIKLYKLADGSFCHKQGGASNGTATVQVFYSMVSYIRMKNGESGLYILDNRNPSAFNKAQEKTTEPKSNVFASDEQSQAKDKTSLNENSSSLKKEESVTRVGNKTESLKGGSTGAVSEKSDHSANESSGVTDASIGESVVYRNNDESSAVISDESRQNSVDVSSKEDAVIKTKLSGYKLWVCLVILLVALLIIIILCVKKKSNVKNILTVLLVMSVAVAFTVCTEFKSVDSYYAESTSSVKPLGRVTITLRCDTIQDKSEEHIPDNGIILESTQFEISENTTVYDVLCAVTAKNKIHMETEGNGDSVYVSGINNIYEFDFGELSGWMYFVNGKAPSVSCGEYIVSDGDEIQWLYTCNLGEDLKKTNNN